MQTGATDSQCTPQLASGCSCPLPVRISGVSASPPPLPPAPGRSSSNGLSALLPFRSCRSSTASPATSNRRHSQLSCEVDMLPTEAVAAGERWDASAAAADGTGAATGAVAMRGPCAGCCCPGAAPRLPPSDMRWAGGCRNYREAGPSNHALLQHQQLLRWWRPRRCLRRPAPRLCRHQYSQGRRHANRVRPQVTDGQGARPPLRRHGESRRGGAKGELRMLAACRLAAPGMCRACTSQGA